MKKALFLVLCAVLVGCAGCAPPKEEPPAPTIKAVEPLEPDTFVPLEVEQQLFAFESPILFETVEVWAETYVNGQLAYESGVLRLSLAQKAPQKGLITASRFSPDQALWAVSVQDDGGGIFIEEPATEQLDLLRDAKENGGSGITTGETGFERDTPQTLLLQGYFATSSQITFTDSYPLTPETLASHEVIQLVVCRFA